MLSLQVSKERYSTPQDGWEPIPFFQAVYHPYSILFGNYSSLTLPPYDDLWPAEFAPKDRLKLLDRKFSTQFRLEQSRAFLWGQQPAIANFLTNQLTERREEINYALRLAQLRAHHLKYLLHGTLLRPPQPRDHAEQPALKFPLSRLSIYAGQQGALTEFEGSSAPVLSAAWQAPNGAIAFFFVNLSDSTMTFPLAANSSDYPLRRRGRIFDATSDSRQQLGNFSQHQVSMSVAIPSRGVRVIELTK